MQVDYAAAGKSEFYFHLNSWNRYALNFLALGRNGDICQYVSSSFAESEGEWPFGHPISDATISSSIVLSWHLLCPPSFELTWNAIIGRT